MQRALINQIRKLVGFPYLSQRLDRLEAMGAKISSRLDSIVENADAIQEEGAGPLPFGENILWESAIQICAKDCASPTSVVLDIGGNVGGLAVAFARMAPQGRVYTFEPNPELWETIRLTLTANGSDNAIHLPLACFSESGRVLEFFSEPGLYKAGSSLVRAHPEARRFQVATISVDDFCEANELSPSLIKIDVEGAEIHVLRSARRTIKRNKPAFILEYLTIPEPGVDDPLVLLEELGYVFFDVNTYKKVSASSYSKTPDILVNVLCLHGSTELAKRYTSLKRTLTHHITTIDGLSVNADIGQGRHVISVQFVLPDDEVGSLGIQRPGKLVAYYEAPGRFLRHHSNSSLVIDVDCPDNIEIRLTPKTTEGARLVSVDIHSITM